MPDGHALKFLNPDGVAESISVEDGRVWTRRTQNVDDHVKWVKHMQDVSPTKHGNAAMRFVGSIPAVVAEQWAVECGAAIGTREFALYCKQKLMDGEFANFRVRGI